ncbi:MAG TPA: hypothetical protein VLP43_10590, partial [Solirubrobacteraceae bacterium]|nr:hypothetical protein [Solirubrobacteraceae bacterium]
EFSPERRQIWYTDGTSGLYVLQLSPTAWPAAARPHLLLTTTTRHSCTGTRVRAVVQVNHDGERPMSLAGALVTLAGHRVRTGPGGTASILLHTAKRRRYRLTVSQPGYAPSSATVRTSQCAVGLG